MDDFFSRMCIVLFLVAGKNLNTKGHHLLAQNSKIPRSTSLVHVLVLVKILGISVWNFFPACMSLEPYCYESLGIFRSV